MEKLSVVVMTFNEEANIERCLASVKTLADDLLVVDSFSTDRTVELAQKMGARVIQHAFDGYVAQRKFSIEAAKFQFVLTIDADEWLSETLATSITAAKNRKQFDCYEMNRCNSIGGQWIRHGGWYPDRKIRLFEREKVRIAGEEPHDKILPVHGASVGRLTGDLLHESDANIASRYFTINKHSTAAARHLFAKGKKSNWASILFKPAARFLSEYVIKTGFLDGFYGFVVALSSAHYVYLREVKLRELWRKKDAGLG